MGMDLNFKQINKQSTRIKANESKRINLTCFLVLVLVKTLKLFMAIGLHGPV
jgi:hypothetical protein